MFLIVPIIVISLIEFRLGIIPNSYSIKKDCLEKNQRKLKVLILGTSQANYALNPQVFDQNGCNIANSNQDLYFDKKLLEIYIQKLPNLQTVIIPVTYFSLEFKLSNTDEAWRQFFYKRWFNISPPDNSIEDRLNIKNWSYLALYGPRTSWGFLYHGLDFSLADNNNEHGWFASPKTSLDDSKGKQRANLHTSEMREEYLNQNRNNLRQMIELLQNKNIRPIVVIIPVTKNYLQNIDQLKWVREQETLNEIIENSNLTLFNFMSDDRFTTSDFADGSDHLNIQGASKFSNILRDAIQSEKTP